MDLDGGALFLEGGGLQGIFTSGVLRFFMDKGIFFFMLLVSLWGLVTRQTMSHDSHRETG